MYFREKLVYISVIYVQEYYIFKASGKQTKRKRKKEREAAVLNMRKYCKKIFIEIVLSKFVSIFLD